MENKEKKNIDRKQNGILYIGDKPFTNYTSGAIMQLNRVDEIVIKARGKYISRAVDVSEVIVNGMMKGTIKRKKLEIGSETFQKEGKDIRVSFIEITIGKI